MTPKHTPQPQISQAYSSPDFWLACTEELAKELPAQQLQIWISPLVAQVADDLSKVTLLISSRVKLDWIRVNLGARLEQLMQRLAGQPVALELALAPRAPSVKPAAVAKTTNLADLAKAALPSAPAASAPASLAKSASAPGITSAPPPNRLDPLLNFDALVEGSANRMARAAAIHIAGMPGRLYNPLFIYGGVGLGKTHLMHAIGNQLISEQPQARVLYIHAEQFVTDFVKASQRRSFDEFKQRYQSLDLLLVDDVQFFANKDGTQEEFFNTFEALLARKSHLVLTSDTYPRALTNIPERLTSRFDSGLTVGIEPPDFEMRVAILLNKAQAEGLAMPQEVAFFVAKNVRSNVRELQGALNNILAYARISNKEISIALVREALRDLLSIKNRQISVENIQKTVADYYRIKVADMYSSRRPASIARPRQIAMYLARELTQISLPEIGDLFGGRDHTTVLHAVKKISKERQQQTELNQQLHVLEQTIKG